SANPKDTAALRTLITRIGDKSNLILDPDLDSFYVMDVVVVKLPALLDDIERPAAAASEKTGNDKLELKDMAQFLQLTAGLSATLGGAKDSLEHAYDANASGGRGERNLKPSLDAEAQDMLGAVTALEQVFDKSTLAGGETVLQPDGFDAP